jgi:hypothetical protein
MGGLRNVGSQAFVAEQATFAGQHSHQERVGAQKPVNAVFDPLRDRGTNGIRLYAEHQPVAGHTLPHAEKDLCGMVGIRNGKPLSQRAR